VIAEASAQLEVAAHLDVATATAATAARSLALFLDASGDVHCVVLALAIVVHILVLHFLSVL